MENKFNQQFNRNSARLKFWDYSSNGIYFITICTKDRVHFFGKIVEDEMILNPEGEILNDFWKLIPATFDFAEIGEFVVMPNHFHGILLITKKTKNTNAINRSSEKSIPDKKRGGFAGEKNPMLNDNVSKIIRWFKGKCTFEIRKMNKEFGWQSRFHDHIIRNEFSFQKIENYIINNPKKWDTDSLK